MRLLAHLLMKLFVLIVQSSVSYLFEMTINPPPIQINPLLNTDRLAVFYSWVCSQGRSQLNCKQAS